MFGSYSFEAFCTDISERARLLNRRLKDPDASWPGVLFLDVPDEGLTAEAFVVAGLSDADKRELACTELPERVTTKRARRFCWAMPAWRFYDDDREREEYLVLVFGEAGRCELMLARVLRAPGRTPRLGRWQPGPFGTVARDVSGLFVDPMLQAVKAVRQSELERAELELDGSRGSGRRPRR